MLRPAKTNLGEAEERGRTSKIQVIKRHIRKEAQARDVGKGKFVQEAVRATYEALGGNEPEMERIVDEADVDEDARVPGEIVRTDVQTDVCRATGD